VFLNLLPPCDEKRINRNPTATNNSEKYSSSYNLELLRSETKKFDPPELEEPARRPSTPAELRFSLLSKADRELEFKLEVVDDKLLLYTLAIILFVYCGVRIPEEFIANRNMNEERKMKSRRPPKYLPIPDNTPIP
jgi:hypothetical protein